MKRTYNYCERCLKPLEIKTQGNNCTYDICSTCAAILLKKIYGEKKDSKND